MDLAVDDDLHSSSLATAKHILERAREAQVEGVLFTGGGEPLIWEHLIDCLQYSHRLGMRNALYTNGFRLASDASFSQHLLAPDCNLAFVRISINAYRTRTFQAHWGLRDANVQLQLVALDRLLKARAALVGHYQSSSAFAIPSIQISTIVNHQNVEDLPLICGSVAKVFEHRPDVVGPEDVMVVRPMTVHGRPGGFSFHDHDESRVIRRIIHYCSAGSVSAQRLAARGVRLFLGFGLDSVASGKVKSYSEVIEGEYAQRDISLANGIFLTVGPGGEVYPSTEYNCDPRWQIGDLKKQSVFEIYGGGRRGEVLGYFNAVRWGPGVAQATARTSRLDRIARAVRSGQLDDLTLSQIQEAARVSPGVLLD